ncbi:MAG TPA: class I SAM-dependent methyltransferase [Chloroflexota bacterium]
MYCNILCPTREDALAVPRGDIALTFCRSCGYIFNAAFDPDLMRYDQRYENSLHCSVHFQQYATALAERLLRQYDLHGKTIIEIGCGQGDFLRLLCQLGNNRGIGFDPAYQRDAPDGAPLPGDVTIVRDYYSDRYAHYRADFVCCRHTLEHVPDPTGFVSMVRRAIADQWETVVFFEVPNALHTLRELAVWDLIYEHCSYFTGATLARLFCENGFQVSLVAETFEGQFLTLDATPARLRGREPCGRPGEVEEIERIVRSFPRRYAGKVASWSRILERIDATGARAVVWGAGSKGVSFLNALPASRLIEYVVDINPRKQGMHVVGTGHEIVPPEFLARYRPDLVVVMNPVYVREIGQMLEELGVTAELVYG